MFKAADQIFENTEQRSNIFLLGATFEHEMGVSASADGDMKGKADD